MFSVSSDWASPVEVAWCSAERYLPGITNSVPSASVMRSCPVLRRSRISVW